MYMPSKIERKRENQKKSNTPEESTAALVQIGSRLLRHGMAKLNEDFVAEDSSSGAALDLDSAAAPLENG